MVSNSPMCLRCFQFDHHRSECENNPVVTCSKCFGLNYLTRDCCDRGWRQNDEYFQSFRMVGIEKTRFFTDIPIMNKNVAGLIDTNRSTTLIDWSVFDKLFTEQANFEWNKNPTTCVLTILQPHPSKLRCNVNLLKNDLRIILGMDFLSQRHVELKLNGVKLTPTLGGKFFRSPESRFQLKILIADETFFGIIDTAATQSKMDCTILNLLMRRKDPMYKYDSQTHLCLTPLTWNGTEVNIQIKVIKQTGTNKLILGTDFLKLYNFEFALDGISLNINNPWKTSHQDAIQFAYNHEQGKKLVLVLKGDKKPRYKDIIRPIMKRLNLSKEKLD